jgi:hypothetical protein
MLGMLDSRILNLAERVQARLRVCDHVLSASDR